LFTVTDRRDQIASYCQLLLQKDRERFDADSKNYERELMSLYELARVLRDSLELNFCDSYILTREPGTGWKWLPVYEVVSKLDQQIK